jgi:hypothetical protein
MATRAQCERALEHFGEWLSTLPNVVGLGVVELEVELEAELEEEKAAAQKTGGKEYAVGVYVSKKLPPSQVPEKDRVPEMLELPSRGKIILVPTKIIAIGEMRPEFTGRE